jgi:UDP-N-acetylglucosamine--N-acetylmuramyl-(pentapeptide) pyrophosphoryl-undecaprenol N-acetylglucosamine transferase
MNILVACGGTAGHINPALAIANEMKLRHPDANILFIGTENNREADLVPRAGYKIEFVKANGFTRSKTFKATKHNIKALFTFASTSMKLRKIIKNFAPDVAIGTGGFVSAPVMYTASKMGIPSVIHEQNAFAGVTTKMLAPRVDKIFLSFPIKNKLDCPESKRLLTGNPIKREFLSKTREEARRELGIPDDVPVVLSCGGSLGARQINDAFCVMARLSAQEGIITHYHGASADYKRVMDTLGDVASAPNLNILEYIYNMPTVMAAADIVINRSGAMTLTEIAALGKASILIPSPNVAENHQYYNAKTYSDIDAAVLIEEKDLDGEKLYALVKELCADRARLHKMEKAALTLAKTDAAVRICEETEKLIESKRK